MGVTRQQAYKQKMANIERSSTSLHQVVEVLRRGSEADAAAALARIRQAEDVDEAIDVLAIAQALVTPTVPHTEASAGSSAQSYGTTGTDLPRRSSQRSLDSP